MMSWSGIITFVDRHHHQFQAAFLISMTIMASGLQFLQPGVLEQIEKVSLDMRFLMRGPIPSDPRIAIVAIDDNSLAEVGRWPWPRRTMGKLIDRILGQYGARALGFDIVFSEPERNPIAESIALLNPLSPSGHEVLWLKKHESKGDTDAWFASLLSKYANQLAMGYFYYPQGALIPDLVQKDTRKAVKSLDQSAISARVFGGIPESMVHIKAVETNIDSIAKAASHAGFFNFSPDEDGKVRRVPLIAEYDRRFYPSLALQTLRAALGWPPLTVQVSGIGVQSLQLGGSPLPIDYEGNLLLNHYGPGGTFQHISAADVLAGRINPDMLAGRIVILGATAVGLYDFRPNPYDVVFPGVEGHAAAMANILNGLSLHRTDKLIVLETIGVPLLTLLIGLLVLRTGPLLQGLTLIIAPLAILAVAQWLFEAFDLWLKVTYFVIGMTACAVSLILLDYLVEANRRSFIRDAFSHYLAPKQVEALEKHSAGLNLGGEERVMTAFFSDIASFSSFSEHMSPTELVSFLNYYLTEMTDIIMGSGGTIDKYEGDAVIAFWGAPITLENHALRCVLGSLQQQQRLRELNQSWKQKHGWPMIHVRMGIDTGSMVIGNMGSSQHIDYTMMGDHVNLASRLEGVSKVYGTSILMSGDTYDVVRNDISARLIDRVRVIGRETPVDIYEPLGKCDEISASRLEQASAYEDAWQMMQERRFKESVELWRQLLQRHPEDAPGKAMLIRSSALMTTPPPDDWDGVYILESK